jgi:hypothetical protein
LEARSHAVAGSFHIIDALMWILAPSKLSPKISKFPLVFSKLFQRFLWPFCEIPRGCNRSKPKSLLSKFFAAQAGPRTFGWTCGDMPLDSISIIMIASITWFCISERKTPRLFR